MNLVNEAALLAARRGKRIVTMAEFEDAKDKVMMGAERRTLVMTEEEKKLTAYHEAGHAIVALNVPATDPVHKATIIPRGRALGMVMQLPERDKLSMSYEQMTSRLAIVMGGRVAEELIFGQEKVTSGAAVRHRAGDPAGPHDGDALGLLRRARHGRLWREPGRGVPRHVGRRASRTSPRRPRRRSTRRFAASSTRATTRPRRILTEKRDDARGARQGPARIRDAVRRRDQGSHQRQAAGARRRRRAVAAALLGRAAPAAPQGRRRRLEPQPQA